MQAQIISEEHDSELEPVATPRLVLRRPEMADVPAVVSLANNLHVAENLMTMPHPYKPSDAVDWINTRTPRHKGARLAITLRECGTLVGAVGWSSKLLQGLDLPQIGYWIGEPFWGNGYATEAAQAMIDHIFSHTDVQELGCSCRVTNVGSRRVIEKCGFQYDGLGMVSSLARGALMPTLKFRMSRSIWVSLKAWGAAAEEPQNGGSAA